MFFEKKIWEKKTPSMGKKYLKKKILHLNQGDGKKKGKKKKKRGPWD